MNLKKKTVASSVSTTHKKQPKVSEMVLLAIAILNDRNGSSVQAILKYMCNNFNVQKNKIAVYVKRYLLMAVASGTLIQTKGKGAMGSFRLGGSMKTKLSPLLLKDQLKSPVKKSRAAPTAVKSPNKVKRGRKPGPAAKKAVQ